MNDNRNLILAMVLSLAVYLGWTYFVTGPQMKAEQAKKAHAAEQMKPGAAPAAPGAPKANSTPAHLSRGQALERGGARIAIETPSVDGTLLLKGARFDDLRLKNYRETVDKKSPEIVLFSPEGTAYPYYAQFGFVGQDKTLAVPTSATQWKQVGSGALHAGPSPVTLTWDNGQGLVFTRVIAVDDKFMFTVTDSVANTSNAKTTLYPYAYVLRDGVPPSAQRRLHVWVLHEGFVGFGGRLAEGPDLQQVQGRRRAAEDFHLHRRLARHHRQILDGGRHPAAERKLRRRLPRHAVSRARENPIRPIIAWVRAPSPRAPRSPSPIACSPARKCSTRSAPMSTG